MKEISRKIREFAGKIDNVVKIGQWLVNSLKNFPEL
jgi:hypothetical protein